MYTRGGRIIRVALLPPNSTSFRILTIIYQQVGGMTWSFQTLFILIMINGDLCYNKASRGYYGSSYRHPENTPYLQVKPMYMHSWTLPVQFPTSPVTDLRVIDEYLHHPQYIPINPSVHLKADSSLYPWYDPYTDSRHYFNKRYSYQGLFRNGVDLLLSRGSRSAMMFDVREDRDRFVDGIPHQSTPDSPTTHKEATGHMIQYGITTATTVRRPIVAVINVDRNKTDGIIHDSVHPKRDSPSGVVGVISYTGQTQPRVGVRIHPVYSPGMVVSGDKTEKAIPPDISTPKPTDNGTVTTEGLPISVALFNNMLSRDPKEHHRLWVPIKTLLEDRESSVAGLTVDTNNGGGINPLSDLFDGPNAPWVKSSHANTGQSVENPFLELMEEMGAFGPGPYYKCHPPSRVVCRANTNWYHVIGIEAWCQQNCVVENYSSYCDDDRCTCLCVDT